MAAQLFAYCLLQDWSSYS